MAKGRTLAVPLGLMSGPDIGLPKYLRLRNALAGAISEGRWKAGARTPTEESLTQATGLSLGTVQRALRTLADDGLIVRRHGMGTFVSSGETPMSAPFYHCRFLDDDGQRLLPIFPRFVRRHGVRGKGPWTASLGESDIVCIERTFSINHEFSIYTHLYFDARRLPALSNAPPAKLSGVNVKDLLAREHHVSLARFSETLRVAVFPPYVCTAIGVKARTSGAILEIVARDRKGDVAYFQDLHIPPSPRRLFIAA
jgi:GntR family transcriptional regulator